MAAHLHEPGSPWFSWGSIRELARRRLTQLEQRREDPRGVRTEEIEAEPGDEYVGVAFTTSYTMNFIRCMLPALAVPPFKVAATRDVSMRLAASATEALAEAVAAPAGGFSAAAEPTVAAPPAQPQRPRVPPDQAAALGVQALKCARAACWDVGWATEAAHPPEKLEQLQRWWDLAARFIRLAATPNQDPADGGEWKRSDLEELLPLRVTKSAAAVSPTPSADVAVALRVGHPQLLELLMRRQASAGGREVDDAFANPLRGMPAYAWSQLLTFTDPRITASLLATVAKLVRRAALRLEAASVAARAELAAGGITCADMFTAGPNSQAVYDSRRISFYAYRYNDHTKAAINIISHVLTPGESALSMADRLRSAAAAAPANSAAAHAEPGNRQRLHSSSSSSSSNGDEAGGGAAESGGATCSGTAAEGGHGGVGAGVSGIGAGDSGAGSSWDRGSSDGGCGAAISGGGSGSSGEVAPGHGTTGDEGAGGPDSTGDSEAEAAAPGRQGSDPHAAAIRGLAVGVSQVAVRVLPDLVRLAANMSAGWGKGFTWTDAMCLQLLLSWVPLLAAASAAGAAPAADMHATQEDPGREGLRDQQPANGGAATAAISAAAAEWDSFLGVDMVLLQLLHLASTAAGMMVGEMQFMFVNFEKSRLAALRALVHFAPRRLARALMAAGSAVPAAVGPALASGSRSNVSAAAAFRPEPLRLLDVPRLREFLGPEGPSPDPDMLTDLERWCTTSGTEVAAATGCVGTSASPAAADPPGPLPSDLRQWAAAAALLVPPSEVRAALPTCYNPLCTNLEGDSEAGLRLSGCGRCGGRVRYCGRECQVAHWKAGHKAECAGASRTSAPASSPAFPSTAASPSTAGLGLG